jgi:hypothetical protein
LFATTESLLQLGKIADTQMELAFSGNHLEGGKTFLGFSGTDLAD